MASNAAVPCDAIVIVCGVAGPCSGAPPNLGGMLEAACPAMVRASAEGKGYVDVCSTDIWTIGTMLLQFFTIVEAWDSPGVSPEQLRPRLQALHNEWVSLQDILQELWLFQM